MEIARIVAVGLITAVSIIVLRETRADIAVIVGIAGGVVLLLMIFAELAGVLEVFRSLAEKTGVSGELYLLLLKIIGVGFITEFAAGVCEESGVKSVGDKIALGGKVVILAMSLPIITAILDIVTGLIAL